MKRLGFYRKQVSFPMRRWLLVALITGAGVTLNGVFGHRQLAQVVAPDAAAQQTSATGTPVTNLTPQSLTLPASLKELVARVKAAPTSAAADAELALIIHFPQTRHLDISGSAVSDSGLAHISGLTELTYLNLSKTGVTDAGMQHLSGLTSLKTLCLHMNSAITGAGFIHLAGLTQLRSLFCHQTAVTDAGLLALSCASGLTGLTLDGTDITNAGLAHLTGIDLETLNLSNTAVGNPGLQHLKDISSLRVLKMDNCGVTGGSINQLQTLSNLKLLSVKGCGLTNQCVASFRAAPTGQLKARIVRNRAQ